MNVLFVGNSHTYFNDMPELFARQVEISSGEKPRVVMLAYSGRDWDWHRREYFSLRFQLMYGGFDYCVIQQAAHPYPPKESTLERGSEIIRLCQRCGVKPVVFMTWAEQRFPENQQKMIDTCRQLCQQEQALLAPIGEVWQKVQQNAADIPLYYKDGEHAGPYGDFLIAAVLCKTLCGKVDANVCGKGFDFIGSCSVDFHCPSLLEEKEAVPVALDEEYCRRILSFL